MPRAKEKNLKIGSPHFQAELDRAYYQRLRGSIPKGGYKWPSVQVADRPTRARRRKGAGRVSGRTISDLMYGRNPKMAKKKSKKRKKRNGMPAGLKAYWAKKRAKKQNRRKRVKKNARIPRKVRRQSYALLKRAVARNAARVRNYRKRKTTTRRRRNSAPRISSRVSRISLPAMSPAATKRVVGILKRMSGNRRVVVK